MFNKSSMKGLLEYYFIAEGNNFYNKAFFIKVSRDLTLCKICLNIFVLRLNIFILWLNIFVLCLNMFMLCLNIFIDNLISYVLDEFV